MPHPPDSAHQPATRDVLRSSQVGLARLDVPGSGYDHRAELRDTIRRACAAAGLPGTDPDRPFAGVVAAGSRVVIKPNWVHHEHVGQFDLDCLITQMPIVDTVLDWVLQESPGLVTVGDAPVQGCDFEEMMRRLGAPAVEAARRDQAVEWVDFRRSVLIKSKTGAYQPRDRRSGEHYVLINLGEDSLLEPLSADCQRFRVTMYDSALMRGSHAPGKHRYLVAREVLDADLVISLPKLKTHTKAGITGAIKNLVGVNGSKDYLPHHRLGGSATGGDCYRGGSRLKLLSERTLDASNSRVGLSSYGMRQAARMLHAAAVAGGSERNLDGAWYGNDTVWRMVLDLNRVVLYARPDGSMADTPQRTLLTITDGVVAGEGEGPLSPNPVPLGLVTAAFNTVAADYAHAHVMGFDWRKIPLVREAFGSFRYPLCAFAPGDVSVGMGGQVLGQPWTALPLKRFEPPRGWAGHV